MASGWNLWVWLPCIGVVSGCCCKEVYRYPHIVINFPYFTCISSFFVSSIPTLFIFKMFFWSYIYIRAVRPRSDLVPRRASLNAQRIQRPEVSWCTIEIR